MQEREKRKGGKYLARKGKEEGWKVGGRGRKDEYPPIIGNGFMYGRVNKKSLRPRKRRAEAM